MARLSEYIERNKDLVMTIITALGVIVAGFGFGMTYVQLQRTTNALQASNTYSVQKDARDIVDKMNGNQEFIDALNNGIPKNNDEPFLSNLWIVLNFYLSVFRQSQFAGLSPEAATSFSRDFCSGFIIRKGASDGWEILLKHGRIGHQHVLMRQQWCKSE